MMRQLSLAALLLSAAPAMAGGQQVRLLIPVLTGTELDQVRSLAPTASIVTINGETFLELGSFKDARVAHRLGLSIQKRLRIPFDLAYDPDHPQIALALGNEPQPMPIAQVVPPAQLASVARQPEPKPQLVPKPATSDPIWSPLVASLNAPELETASARVVQVVAPVEEEVQPPAAETTPVPVAAEPALPLEAHLASTHSLHPGSARTEQNRRSSKRAHPETREASAISSSVVEDAMQPRRHPWLKPVQIAAVKVEAPLSHSGIAINPQLNYIYVKIRKPSDVARLNRITPVLELNPVGDTLMARVGVFTQSHTGRRLMEARIQQLKHQQVDLIIANGSELREMVV